MDVGQRAVGGPSVGRRAGDVLEDVSGQRVRLLEAFRWSTLCEQEREVHGDECNAGRLLELLHDGEPSAQRRLRDRKSKEIRLRDAEQSMDTGCQMAIPC